MPGDGGNENIDALLEEALARVMLLAEVSTVLGSSLDSGEVLKRLARFLVPQLADWCVVDMIDEATSRVRRVALEHRDPEAVMAVGTEVELPKMDPVSQSPLERVLEGAGPLLFDRFPPEGTIESPLWHAKQDLVRRLGIDTAIFAPLRVRRRVLGALTLARTDPRRPFTEDDIPLVKDLTHRVGLAIDNARLYAAERETSQDFQRALLPELPEVDHLEMAARYTAARGPEAVGGDWYDAFVLPDGVTALVVGDVTGHDRKAAVRMAQIRNMLRAVAWGHREPPSRIMERLDEMLPHLTAGGTATAVYGRVEGPVGGLWRWHWTNAGHVQPLLVTRDGDTRYLVSEADVLLGVDSTMARTDAVTELPPLSTLLLYTDGLVERRGESLDRGLVRLRQQIAALAHEPVDVLCDTLLEEMPEEPFDDVVLLGLRVPERGAGLEAAARHGEGWGE